MSENIESRCWDCPSRKGLSRLSGKIACAFYGAGPTGRQRIKEQRGDCGGAVPVRLISQGSTSITKEGATVAYRTVWHDTYLAACPKKFDTPPEAPDEVKTAMRVNHLDVFTHERVDINTQPLADYEQKQVEIMNRMEAIMAEHAGGSDS